MRPSYARPVDHASPVGQPTPSSNISVNTPSSAASPRSAPSPTMKVTQEVTRTDRARMFAQCQHDQLLAGLNGKERR